jgi:hypothetical protein
MTKQELIFIEHNVELLTGMPGKRQGAQYGFDRLSLVADTPTDEASEGSDKEGTVCRVMMVADAPTDSKFYSDAQECFAR